MNLSLIPFSLALPVTNLYFYPEKMVESCFYVVYKDANIQIKITSPKIMAEIYSYFSNIEIQQFMELYRIHITH